jgi:hypothetical protein
MPIPPAINELRRLTRTPNRRLIAPRLEVRRRTDQTTAKTTLTSA